MTKTTPTTEKAPKDEEAISALFEVGAHYGYSRSRRHPSTEQYIFGLKNTIEIFDLKKTHEALERAQAYMKKLGKEGKQVLFVGSKKEAQKIVREGAESADVPYIVGRWIGGTLTNFSQIRKRVERLQKLRKQRKEGELEKYTKREQMLLDKEIKDLEATFGGITDMEKKPHALFVVDPREEDIAVKEAQKLDIPIVALANSDCDVDIIEYPIPANDANIASIQFFVDAIVDAYKEGKEAGATQEKKEDTKNQKEDTK